MMASVPEGYASAKSSKTILLVEDSKQASTIISHFLVHSGYRVVLAATGAEAIAKAEEIRPSAILLDLLLPVKDGWEVLAELKSTPATGDIPVVVMSVLDQFRLSFELGASDHLVKPIDRRDLLKAIESSTIRQRFAGHRPKIMIGHRDTFELGRLSDALIQAGHEVFTIVGSAEGIDLAARTLPDLVIVHRSLGYGNFFALHSALIRNPATRHIGVCMLAPRSQSQELHRRFRGHVELIEMQEPLSAVQLVAAVETAVRRVQVLSHDRHD